ncbi:MAG: hypothetical protein ABFE13_11855, partial [Phycisphaerales bacterium]
MSNQALTTDDGEGCQQALIAMIHNLGCIDQTQFNAAKETVRTLQNHNDDSRASAAPREWFDGAGRLAWSMDELGRVTSRQYNPLTGRLAQTIEDIDAAIASALRLTPPAGWTLPASGGANLATEYQYDAFCRTTYTETIVGPISITRTDRDGRTTERVQAAYNGTLAGLVSAAISQSDYTAWTTFQTEELGCSRLQWLPCVEPNDFCQVAPGHWDAARMPILGSPA